MIVCLIGGTIGIILGGVLGYVGTSLFDVGSLPTISSIAISVGFSLGIGLFFGYYPANKAALLDPIEALRYE
jgi:putative ABC transport system permease protein